MCAHIHDTCTVSVFFDPKKLMVHVAAPAGASFTTALAKFPPSAGLDACTYWPTWTDLNGCAAINGDGLVHALLFFFVGAACRTAENMASLTFSVLRLDEEPVKAEGLSLIPRRSRVSSMYSFKLLLQAPTWIHQSSALETNYERKACLKLKKITSDPCMVRCRVVEPMLPPLPPSLLHTVPAFSPNQLFPSSGPSSSSFLVSLIENYKCLWCSLRAWFASLFATHNYGSLSACQNKWRFATTTSLQFPPRIVGQTDRLGQTSVSLSLSMTIQCSKQPRFWIAR